VNVIFTMQCHAIAVYSMAQCLSVSQSVYPSVTSLEFYWKPPKTRCQKNCDFWQITCYM